MGVLHSLLRYLNLLVCLGQILGRVASVCARFISDVEIITKAYGRVAFAFVIFETSLCVKNKCLGVRQVFEQETQMTKKSQKRVGVRYALL